MRCTEGVVAVDVAHRGELVGEVGITRGLAGMEPQVLKQHDLAVAESVRGRDRRGVDAVITREEHPTGGIRAEQSREGSCDGCEAEVRFVTVSGRAPEMRHQRPVDRPAAART